MQVPPPRNPSARVNFFIPLVAANPIRRCCKSAKRLRGYRVPECLACYNQRLEKPLIYRVITISLALAFMLCQSALAITVDEIPREVRMKLPDFLFYLINPQALAMLSLEDITEYANAWESGDFHFVNDVRVESSGGPIPPSLATLILQVPQGAPYIESRFVRIAKNAVGQGAFTSLQWRVFENSDSSVDLQIYYESGEPVSWIPDIGSNVINGWTLGMKYQDMYYGGKDRQLMAGVSTGMDVPDEVNAYASFRDNTVNGGWNSYSISGSVRSDGRRRRNRSAAVADIRDRISRVDGSYSWNGKPWFGEPGGLSAGAGLYNQEHYLVGGDPTAGGTAPRSDFSQSGTAGYASVAWGGGRKNLMFTPSHGSTYVGRLEQHLGDFTFTRFTYDVRKYIPADNILGYGVVSVDNNGNLNDIKQMFPAASISLQAQASIADGDVPYSQEIRLGNAGILRGIPYDYYAGTKMFAGRGEYHFALGNSRAYEGFVFSDHAVIGEEFGNMEAFNTYGIGGLANLPIYGGFKLGAFFGWEYDGGDDTWGLALGYQF